MTPVPSPSDDGDRPLFADYQPPDRPAEPPLIRRRTDIPPPVRALAAPPRTPAPTPAPSAAARVAPASVLIGRINSQVTEDRQPYQFFGFAMLLAVVLAAIGAVCLYATGGILIALLVGGLMLIVMAVMLGRLIGGWSAVFAMIGRGLIWLVSRVVALGMRGAGAAAGGLSQPHGMSHDLIVQRFQVQLATGSYITCFLPGRLADSALRRDDHVGIVGRSRKDRFIVRSIDVFSGPGGSIVRRVRATQPLGLRIVRWLDRGAFVLAVLLVAALIVMIVHPVRQ